MLTKKAQHTWVEENLDLDGLTVNAVKNKLANLKKKGGALVEKHVKPVIRAAVTPLPTGSEAPEPRLGGSPEGGEVAELSSILRAVRNSPDVGAMAVGGNWLT